MGSHRLHAPFDEHAIRALAVGDTVLLDGVVTMTIGMPTHLRIIEHLDAGKRLPIDLADGTFFHLSCYNRDGADGPEALYMNPTTSTRFNHLMPRIIRELRPRMIGGKGGLDAACVEAMREVGCVYLSFLGGGCTLLADAIRGVVSVHWPDLISQFRLVTLRVEALEGIVAIDANGGSVYETLKTQAEERLPGILRRLDAARDASR
jgi:fumarate hydratase subunit beta